MTTPQITPQTVPQTVPPTLTTERLTLGPLTMAHFEAFARFTGGDRRAAWDSCAANAGQWALRGYGPFWVSETATGAAVGRVGLWHPITYDRPELAWTVYPAFQGQSLGFEAATAVRDWAANHGLPTLVSYIAPDNSRSIALARRMGAVQIASRDDGALTFEHPPGATAPALTTDRLRLGGPSADWLAALDGFIGSDRAQWFFDFQRNGPAPLLSRMAETARAGRGAGWCLYDRATDAPAGMFALWHPADRADPGLSWFLFDGFEGRGLIPEAAKTVAAWVLAHTDITEATAHVAHANPRSRRVAARLAGRWETDFDKDGQRHHRFRHRLSDIAKGASA